MVAVSMVVVFIVVSVGVLVVVGSGVLQPMLIEKMMADARIIFFMRCDFSVIIDIPPVLQ